jgi:hypothetical protein
MRGTVNGWTIVHVRTLHFSTGSELAVGHVTLESQDARINGHSFRTIGPLQSASENAIYAVKFKNSEILRALLLDPLK